MALRGLREYEIEQLRRIDETWSVSPLVLATVSRCVELHDEARGLRSLLHEGRVPQELAKRLQEAKQERGELFLADVMRLVIDWLFLEHEHERESCEICGNTPDEIGMIEHGRGCFAVSEDGGGISFAT